MSDPITLELAKIIVDNSYYGLLINYAQLSNMIAKEHEVNYDEMWSFSDEIHNFLGNRPKMFPGYIGGHCVIPNLDLMHNQTLNLIKKRNGSNSKGLVPTFEKVPFPGSPSEDPDQTLRAYDLESRICNTDG